MCNNQILNGIVFDGSNSLLISRILRERLVTDRGFSYDPYRGVDSPDSGYMVSLSGYEKVFPDISYVDIYSISNKASSAKRLALHSDHISGRLNSAPHSVGGWVADDGKVYLDVSINIADLEQAKAFGRVNQQLAIWDCANKVSIDL